MLAGTYKLIWGCDLSYIKYVSRFIFILRFTNYVFPNYLFPKIYALSLSLSRYIFSNSDASRGDYSHMIGQSASESSQARDVDYVLICWLCFVIPSTSYHLIKHRHHNLGQTSARRIYFQFVFPDHSLYIEILIIIRAEIILLTRYNLPQSMRLVYWYYLLCITRGHSYSVLNIKVREKERSHWIIVFENWHHTDNTYWMKLYRSQ